jgi:hypothetical protein
MVDERDIAPEWIEHVLRSPVFAEPDPAIAEQFELMPRSQHSVIACFGSFIMILERNSG